VVPALLSCRSPTCRYGFSPDSVTGRFVKDPSNSEML
jgi:hypothetical protein